MCNYNYICKYKDIIIKMEADSRAKDEILEPKANEPLPRPIPVIECGCDCGYTFQPNRRDQMYLNKQHADFAYNHGKRKLKNRNRNKVEKILLKNDNILEKHFKAEWREKEVDCYFDVIKAEGFNFSYHVGKGEEDGIDYYFTYNYNYFIHTLNKIKMIKILKK